MTTTTKDTRKITFLNEWTPTQFTAMQRAILNHFKGKTIQTHREPVYFPNIGLRFNNIDNVLGLAYTSTGIWACYGVCNTSPYFDLHNIYQYSYFVMDQKGKCYAILQDKDENELIISL